jgi:hypothetical protein
MPSRMTMQDYARLGESLGGAYATYQEKGLRNRKPEEIQQFTPEQRAAAQEDFVPTEDMGQIPPGGLAYTSATGERKTVAPPQTQYRLGGLTQAQPFTPEQVRMKNEADIREQWKSQGTYGQERAREYDDSRARGLQATAAEGQIKLQDVQLAGEKLKEDLKSAAQRGRKGMMEMYNKSIPDGQDAIDVDLPGGGFAVYLVPEGETDVTKGALYNKFSGDKRLGLTPEFELYSHLQGVLGDSKNVLEIMKLRQQATEVEQKSKDARAGLSGTPASWAATGRLADGQVVFGNNREPGFWKQNEKGKYEKITNAEMASVKGLDALARPEKEMTGLEKLDAANKLVASGAADNINIAMQMVDRATNPPLSPQDQRKIAMRAVSEKRISLADANKRLVGAGLAPIEDEQVVAPTSVAAPPSAVQVKNKPILDKMLGLQRERAGLSNSRTLAPFEQEKRRQEIDQLLGGLSRSLSR